MLSCSFFPANDKACVLNELGRMFLTFGDRSSACRYFRQAALTAQPDDQGYTSPAETTIYSIQEPYVKHTHTSSFVMTKFKVCVHTKMYANTCTCTCTCTSRCKCLRSLWKQQYGTVGKPLYDYYVFTCTYICIRTY